MPLAILGLSDFIRFSGGGNTPSVPSPSDWATVVSAVTDTFSIANIASFVTAVVGAGIGFVLFWWGLRMAFRSIMGAVKNGTLSISGGRRRRR